LENLTDSDDINRAWENSKEHIKPQLKRAFHCMNWGRINRCLLENL